MVGGSTWRCYSKNSEGLTQHPRTRKGTVPVVTRSLVGSSPSMMVSRLLAVAATVSAADAAALVKVHPYRQPGVYAGAVQMHGLQ
jgi:hypothetical protein